MRPQSSPTYRSHSRGTPKFPASPGKSHVLSISAKRYLTPLMEKGMTEDEIAGWHHWLDAREFEWTPGVGDGQGGLACCNSWGCKESDMTEWLNWTELNHKTSAEWTSLVAQMVKRLPTMQETWVQYLGREDLLEKEMATHSSILAWKIPWMEPGRLQSMGSQRVGHDWATSFTSLHFTSLCILQILSWCNWDCYERWTSRINTIVLSMPSGCRVYIGI